jgi:hypothetical protein
MLFVQRRITEGTKNSNKNNKRGSNANKTKDGDSISVEEIKSVRHFSEVEVRVEFGSKGRIFFFIPHFGNVEDFTRSILNLGPKFIKHGVSLRNKCNVERIGQEV